jgi:hypothetical protein
MHHIHVPGVNSLMNHVKSFEGNTDFISIDAILSDPITSKVSLRMDYCNTINAPRVISLLAYLAQKDAWAS